jgi:hypothetical protein
MASQPLPSPAGGDDYGDDNDNADPCSSPPGSSLGTSNPQRDIEAALGTITPHASGPGQCPTMPRKHAGWAAYELAKEFPSSTTFERYATGKHSQSMIYAEMLADFFTPPSLKHRS